MPVRRFHSVEEMNQPRWREPGDPDLYKVIRALWEFGRRTSRTPRHPGVRRFRSLEEMKACRSSMPRS